MLATDRSPTRTHGQMLVLFALVLSVVILGVGLVIDGGNALVQRRGSQNASDFAALAGARVIAEFIDGDTTNGSDVNVHAAIANAVAANGGLPITFGAPSGPRYIDSNGALLGYVGTGAIPAGAVGVKLSSSRTFRPYFLGIVGMNTWTASSEATAKGGYTLAGPPPGTLFPVGIALSFFQTYPFCAGDVSTNPADPLLPAAAHAGQPQCAGRLRLAHVRLRWVRHGPGSAGQRRRLREQQALPPGGDRATQQQLWLLHAGRSAGQPRPDRQPTR